MNQRDQVIDLLKQTSDLKLLQGDPGKVLDVAQACLSSVERLDGTVASNSRLSIGAAEMP